MQLIECYIENFGKFSKYKYSFTAGLNEIVEENGWGKSTMAAFIKVMFYGFDDEKKRSGEKERKKYEPWQGGEYGGRLTFQTREGTFTVCRSFGRTEKSDEFKLLDALTGTETVRFGKELGRELFQIDRDTFFNTLYISQTDRRSQVTNDIHARIGSQDHVLEDISGYQEIEKRIKDELNHATPKRKGGFLYELEKKISEMKQEQRKRAKLEETAEKRQEQIEAARHQKRMLQEQTKDLQEQRSQITIYEGLAAKKKHYEELLAEQKARQAALEQARSLFPGRIPAKEECRQMQTLAEQLMAASQEEELYRLTDGEQQRYEELTLQFGGQAPTSDMLLVYEDKYMTFQRLRMELAAQQLTAAEEQQLQRYGKQFSESVTPDQFDPQIENIRVCARLRSILQEQRMTLSAVSIAQREAEQGKPKEAGRHIPWQLPAGGVCVLAGISVLAASWNMIAGMLMLLAGICLCLWALYAGKKSVHAAEKVPQKTSETDRLRQEINEGEQRLEILQKDIHRFLEALNSDCPDQEMEGRLYELRADCSAYQTLLAKQQRSHVLGTETQAKQLYKELYGFLTQYVPLQAEDDQQFDGALRKLEQDEQLYRQLRAKKQNWQRADAARSRLGTELTAAFGALSMVPGPNISWQLRMLNEYIQQYEQCKREADQSRERIIEFSKHEDLETLIALKPPQSVKTAGELDEQIRALEQQSIGLQSSIDQYSRMLEQSDEELDQLAAAAEELKELEEQCARVKMQYGLLELTQSYLDEAKRNLTNRYTKPLLDSLKKYYEILASGEECYYTMDANISVSLDIGSMSKELSTLSMGYQDLSWMCMRLAFIEAMYQNEKPFMIMDDPFVNMDERKLEGGKRLLQQMSADYQILYFTCHKSRGIKASIIY